MKRSQCFCLPGLLICLLVGMSFLLWGCSNEKSGNSAIPATPQPPVSPVIFSSTVAPNSTPLATLTRPVRPSYTPTLEEYKTPTSIKDIQIPPEASGITYKNSREVNFFVPISRFENISALYNYYNNKLPFSGWENCTYYNCQKQFATATDSANSFYSFNPAHHRGPFLQITGCPDEIVSCKEKAQIEGGFRTTIFFIDDN